MDFQLGLELSVARSHSTNINALHHTAVYEEYPASSSFVSTCSSMAMSTSSSTSSSSCNNKRVSVVMMHNPYSFDAFTYMHRLSEEASDESCECEGNESCDGSDCEEASPTSSKTKKPKKKNVRCPNGHRAAKRLRYRKGQSHYSCNECSIRWKVDDPKRRPAFLAASE